MDDQLATVVLGALRDVQVAADDEVGAGVYHQPRQLPLTLAGRRLALPAPMHEGNHQIGAAARAARMSATTWLSSLQAIPGRSVGFEERGSLVVAKERDAHSFLFDPQRRVRLRQILAHRRSGGSQRGRDAPSSSTKAARP